MESYDANRKLGRRDAVIEALLAPGDSSFVDALLALADDAANHKEPGGAEDALIGGLQAALARRMRAVIKQDDTSRRAA